MTAFADAHRETLDRALAALADRGYWSAYPESPSPRVYGETAAAEGLAAYEAHLGKRFELDQPGTVGWVGAERSPYGPELGVTYPRADLDVLLAAARDAMPAWRDAGPAVRAGVCVEIVNRINRRSFEMANAVMHTSGQAFVMAFQAGGPHAQDRALEAIAVAYAEQTRVPATARWEKPQGKRPPVVMEKTYTVVPRGIGLVIGCTTFPTWNSYPGLFASLACGNPVVVKPHPGGILPLAITVSIAREVLAEAGFGRDLVTLVAEDPGGTVASDLAVRPEVKVVDFTGSTAYGEWLEEHARQASVYTEKAGVNMIVLDSTDDYAGMLSNLAFSLCLYSGQMCTTPQNLLIPADGIRTPDGVRGVDQFAADLGAAIDALLGEDKQAVELLGAVVNDAVLGRVEGAGTLGDVVVPSRTVTHPAYPDARVRTPVVVRVAADRPDVWGAECFGPVAFLVTTESTDFGLELLRRTVTARGALTAAVYSTDEKVVAGAREAALDAGVALSENLTGGVYVNQSAAFSDFHATGANPAANAAYTDAYFVSGRFRVVQSRRHTA
ncbi:MAG: Phenylacetic acid degradation protein PaaN2, ring-opening aldehyde dehydrogenase [uncultured Corynebacteriales bacterium]|uniref:Phenylacetic acid degradation protein PaaN2, ring-opening aldehyde dehydrogenase n=1 Tax=uncultured Mycobacteriales bacterium TaxID=581187 RepID=A0A6J4JXH6_9ACTN|nr:MAG: Phenylacetic acid degradation protein PaaN2, ring-opening aldehyde dehydrogenase [uncultured Corynebacteriales bacterium]